MEHDAGPNAIHKRVPQPSNLPRFKVPSKNQSDNAWGKVVRQSKSCGGTDIPERTLHRYRN
jgi:hypothetical protein